MARPSRRLVAAAVALTVLPAVALADPSPNAPKGGKGPKTTLFTYPKRDLGCIYVAAKPDYVVCATRPGEGVMLSGRTPFAARRNLGKPKGKRPVIAYGTSRKVGRFTCSSARNGITCKARNGAGFRIDARRITIIRHSR
jgi:hypothetical protein